MSRYKTPRNFPEKTSYTAEILFFFYIELVASHPHSIKHNNVVTLFILFYFFAEIVWERVKDRQTETEAETEIVTYHKQGQMYELVIRQISTGDVPNHDCYNNNV